MSNNVIDLLLSAQGNGVQISLKKDVLQVKVPRDKMVDQRLLDRIKEHKQSIIEYLQDSRLVSEKIASDEQMIAPGNGQAAGHLPLSFAQERLWFIDKLHGSVQYHLSWVFKLKGESNIDALEASFQAIVNRHEVLRTVIHEEDGKGYQVILPAGKWHMHIINYKECATNIDEYISDIVLMPFDLSADHPLRVHLIRVDSHEYVLVAVMHHIAFDGWSLPLLVNELAEHYKSITTGTEVSLPKLPVQYADYAIWQRKHLSAERLAAKLANWKSNLEDAEPLRLPVDFIRPESQSVRGGIAHREVNAQLYNQLNSLARKEGVTLFMLLVTAFKILLAKYSGQNDICIGIPVAGRQHTETEPLIGFFINTLALRTKLNIDEPCRNLLQQVKQMTLAAYENQEVPFEKIVEALGIERDKGRNPLFQVIFALQNIQEPAELDFSGVELSAVNAGQLTSQFDINFNITVTSEGLRLSMSYCSDLFCEHTIKRMLQHYEQLLHEIVQGIQKPVGDLSIISPDELKQLRNFNDTAAPYPSDKNIIEIFTEQVKQTPQATALIFENVSYTYEELDACTNQLANYLVSKGAQHETLIPVCLERSEHLVISILGILKAGAVYVPVDPAYPPERIAYMLHDIDARLIIARSDIEVQLPENINQISIDEEWPLIMQQAKDCAVIKSGPSSLAYVMYTSGSTGTPKGVMVEHCNIISLVKGVKYVKLDEETRLLSTGSPSFDATTIEYWGTLLNGGTLVMCSQHTLFDTRQLKSLIKSADINTMWFTAGWFNQLAETDLQLFAPLQTILAGGDRLSAQHVAMVKNRYPHLQIINGYGPTENTTFSLTYHIKELPTDKEIPVGIPLENRTAYILDNNLRLCPIGLTGEIYVGGAGLSRGYWKQQTLTGERFREVEGLGKIYSTGDLGRWLPDGNIEFLGRKDNQVKIRGYRVEPGEIENVLQQAPDVRQAVVTIKTEGNTKKLVAYVVVSGMFDKPSITTYLETKLPDYMVPGIIIELDEMPLTANGKVDRKRLPDAGDALETGTYAAPRNEMEEQLAAMWQELLGVEHVGIHDNFFELGGDSIITIQVVSRARRLGYELQVGDLFTHQTIAALSEALSNRTASPVAKTANETLQGNCGLLPIQQWYFEGEPADVSHFNQSVLLNISKQANKQILEQALHALVRHHDALRFVYHRTEKGWQQEYGNYIAELETVDARSVDIIRLHALITTKCNACQQSLDIEKGILLKAVFFETPKAETHNRLFLAIHHLAVDGVSWRIILEDLEILLSALKAGNNINLANKTASYRDWYTSLEKYAEGNMLLSQKNYWNAIALQASPLPVDKQVSGTLTVNTLSHQLMQLRRDETRQLLQESQAAYRTDINDLLLAALTKTLCHWCKRDKVIIGLEGHGREQLGNEDVSRTVGWFTSLYPVLLELEPAAEESEAALIQSVKEQLRKVPAKGMGYGILKYISKEPSLRGNDPWEIVFNYLGQVDNTVSRSEWFSGASENTGNPVSLRMAQRNKLEINCVVSGGRLNISFNYNGEQYRAVTIEQLAEDYTANLQQLIEHCVQQAKIHTVCTPSDYRLGSIVTWQELDNFLGQEINGRSRRSITEAVYRLSGLQQGILFHSLYDKEVHSYINQFSCDIVNPDIDAFTKSWKVLLSRHSILRTSFHHDAFSLPVQCVHRNVEMPLSIIDLTQYAEQDRVKQLIVHVEADAHKPFDFAQPPLMRVTLLQVQPGRFRMLWTFHHLIIDGWSIPIIIQSFLETYNIIASGAQVKPVSEDSYEDYIRHIYAGDKTSEETYWREYMNGLENGSLLPFISSSTDRNSGLGIFGRESLELNDELSNQIQHYIQQNRITANTLMQGVWAQLLHRYTGKDHVVYGVTVSGRPEDLAGIEHRVGMYINTLPLHVAVNGSQTIPGWLRQLQQQQVASRQYQYSALSDILGWSDIQGELFDSLLVFENYPVDEVIGASHWKLEVENVEVYEQTNYPLSIEIAIGRNINIRFNYNAALLPEAYAKKIAGHFEQALLSIVSLTDDAIINNIEILTNAELLQLKSFNNNTVAYPSAKTIVELFNEQVIRTPNAIALICGDERYSYKEIQQHANQLANELIDKGLKAEQPVPVILNRGYQWLVSILAIWKAGAVYVPIDPAFPEERINYIINELGASLVISKVADYQHEIETLTLPAIQPSSLAYIIYTSGSTGKPKGAMIEHAGMLNHLYCKINELGIGAGTRIAQTASATFDISVWQLFAALIKGGTSVIYTDHIIQDPLSFLKHLEWDGITIAEVVPSYLSSILEEEYTADQQTLTHLLVTGEAIYPALLQKWFARYPRKRVVNAYGPTEASDDICHHHMTAAPSGDTVPVGKPVQNMHIYILSRDNKLCPVGATGEICVSGIGVGRGYWNDDEKTRRSFTTDPFTAELRRMYRTGDRGRWLPDGTVEYLGRMDEQVKINGFRIELGEIESVLQNAPCVKTAAAIAMEDQGNKRLIGYVVTDDGFDLEAVSAYMKQRLPAYMMPAMIVRIESMPLTANGKADRKKLPTPSSSSITAASYAEPRTATEKELVTIWQSVLKKERIGILDNFFELGGQSLIAMRLASVIRQQTGKEISIRDIFLHPTIEQLAAQTENHSIEHESTFITKAARPAFIPLSFAQERLWFIDRLQGSAQYHMPWVFRLHGPLNVAALEASFLEIVNRHEVLRTVVGEEDGRGHQIVLPADDWELAFIHHNSIAGFNSLNEYLEAQARQPFDLSGDTMLRVHIIQLNDNEHILAIILHHIAFDGWSISVMVDELAKLYESHAAGKAHTLQQLPLQYTDYAIWQRSYLSGERLSSQLSYWTQQLQDVQALDLSTDYSRPAEPSINGSSVQHTIGKSLRDQAIDFAQQEQATLFMILLSAFKVLLHQYTSQHDICVGTPVAGRSASETDRLIGLFVNTLALRSSINGDEGFSTLVKKVKQTTIDAYEHQDVPFEKIVESLGLERDMGRTPVFQVMFALQNLQGTVKLELGDIDVQEEPSPYIAARFEIGLYITESPDGLHLSAVYNKDIFRQDTIERMLMHYEQLLHSLLSDAKKPIAQASMLTADEEKQLIEFSNSSVEYPTESTIVEYFEQHAQRNPNATALQFKQNRISYAELNAWANRISRRLQRKGVQVGDRVGLSLETCPAAIASILGTLKSGGGYVPIDPDIPAQRKKYIIENTGMTLLLSDERFSAGLQQELEMAVEIIDVTGEEIQQELSVDLPLQATSGDLIYVIYTSGSTGIPKGVMITHRNIMDYVYGLEAVTPAPSCSSFAFMSTLAADVGNTSIFAALAAGKTLHIFSKDDANDAQYLQQYFNENTVDCLKIVSSHWKALSADELLLPQKLLMLGGEALEASVVERIWKHGAKCTVVNHYGPTEATIGKLMHHVQRNRQYSGVIPIGKPFGNAKIYVLSPSQQLCPVGVPGELYLGGDGIALGYINDPVKTAEKFIEANVAGCTRLLYRTGDRVKFLPEGDILFISRFDSQVKIKGYRIELSEVEQALLKCTGVRQAVVIVHEDKQGSKRLVAYAIGTAGFSKEGVINELKAQLPAWMMPSAVIELDEMPFLPNGKVNRKRLPDPGTIASDDNKYQAPRNATEEQIAKVWQELLGAERIGIYDNFFELGGDSIITIQVVSRLKRAGFAATVRDLFIHQTIAKLTEQLIQRAAVAEETTAEQGVLTGECGLLPIQQWYLDNRVASLSHYNQEALLNIDKSIDASVLQQAITQLVNHHDALRFRYINTDGHWQQLYGEYIPEVDINDLQNVVEHLSEAITQRCNTAQHSLDIEKGITIRVVLMHTPQNEQYNRLFIVIHHIAIDGVSWRILLDDLRLALTAIANGEPVLLGNKTNSYREWYNALVHYGKTRRLLSQRKYWKQVVRNFIPLSTDNKTEAPALRKDTRSCVTILDTDNTKHLLQHISTVYRTDINDILLAALTQTMCAWSGNNSIIVGLEGHGREMINNDIDTTRTVGWFTTIYPVLLQQESNMTSGELIRSVKEQMRRIPDKGIGFGVLKYINRESTLQQYDAWHIGFNYLGQLDSVAGHNGVFNGADELAGDSIGQDFVMREKLSLTAIVHEGQLILNWNHSSTHYKESTIQTLSENYLAKLRSLITHCMEQASDEKIHTPADFGLSTELNYRELEQFLGKEDSDMEDVMTF